MKTALQEVFSELERLHPSLFDIYTQQGREFVNNFHKFLEMEKNDTDNKVIHFAEWLTKKHTSTLITLYEHFEEEYYNETFKSE